MSGFALRDVVQRFPKRKVTLRDRILAQIGPFYPKGEGVMRRQIGLARMPRMYVAQQCLGLFDVGIEYALYDSKAIRRFVDIDQTREDAPHVTTMLKFHRILEARELTHKIFETINAYLPEQVLVMREGTIVDGTLIAARTSTIDGAKGCDSEMYQTNKGTNWNCGMKAHIGVGAKSGLVQTVIGTPANVSDVTGRQMCDFRA